MVAEETEPTKENIIENRISKIKSNNNKINDFIKTKCCFLEATKTKTKATDVADVVSPLNVLILIEKLFSKIIFVL